MPEACNRPQQHLEKAPGLEAKAFVDEVLRNQYGKAKRVVMQILGTNTLSEDKKALAEDIIQELLTTFLEQPELAVHMLPTLDRQLGYFFTALKHRAFDSLRNYKTRNDLLQKYSKGDTKTGIGQAYTRKFGQTKALQALLAGKIQPTEIPTAVKVEGSIDPEAALMMAQYSNQMRTLLRIDEEERLGKAPKGKIAKMKFEGYSSQEIAEHLLATKHLWAKNSNLQKLKASINQIFKRDVRDVALHPPIKII